MIISPVEIARIAHEVNRAYCNATGDTSQPAWEDAPDWQANSAIQGVRFHLSNPDVTPEQSHENWLKQKLLDGWCFGVKKDPERREHPCMLPYHELPIEQRVKDHLFVAVVRASRSLVSGGESHERQEARQAR